jgi:hypothetical protein
MFQFFVLKISGSGSALHKCGSETLPQRTSSGKQKCVKGPGNNIQEQAKLQEGGNNGTFWLKYSTFTKSSNIQS